jgi:hypothetical protein
MKTKSRIGAPGLAPVFAVAVAVVLVALPVQAAGPFQYHSLTPCRLADTRNAAGPSGGPILTDQGTRTFPVQGLCNVPVGAKAVSVNITAVGPTGGGFLTLFPTGITRPVVSSVNFNPGEAAIGNGAIVPLADQAVHPSIGLPPRAVGSRRGRGDPRPTLARPRSLPRFASGAAPRARP